MSATSADVDRGRWQAEGHALTIQYSRTVLDDIRAEVVNGFCRLPHGGVEVGGVLYGSMRAGEVRILAYRRLELEYAHGPGFVLSESDHGRMRGLLEAPHPDGLEPVGWYHSHTRSEIQLTDKDLELFERYFPQPWHVALVLRPYKLEPTRAGFFFREDGDRIHSQGSYVEFPVHPLKRAPAFDPLPVPEAPVPEALAPEALTPSAPPRKRRGFWAIAWLPAVVLLLAAVVGSRAWWLARTPEGVALRLLEHGGMLRIEWDRSARAAAEARSGVLEILDGSARVRAELDAEQVRRGTAAYVRRAENVIVRLELTGPDGRQWREAAHFIGAPVAQPAAPEVPVVTAPPPRESPKLEAEPPRREQRRARRFAAPLPSRTPAGAPMLQPPSPEVAYNSPLQAPQFSPLPKPQPPAQPAASAPPVASAPPPVRSSASPAAPAAGKLLWTGRLGRRGVVEIQDGRASIGFLSGKLPGVPVRLRVFPGDLSQDGIRLYAADTSRARLPAERPGPQNGWNATRYLWDARRAGAVQLLEVPNPDNAWKRVVLRNNQADAYSVLVIEWETQ